MKNFAPYGKRKTSGNIPKKQNLKKVKYSAFAKACDRTGITDRTAAFICSSMLCDMSNLQLYLLRRIKLDEKDQNIENVYKKI